MKIVFRIIHEPNYLSLTVILPYNKVIVLGYFILSNGIIFTPDNGPYESLTDVLRKLHFV